MPCGVELAPVFLLTLIAAVTSYCFLQVGSIRRLPLPLNAAIALDNSFEVVRLGSGYHRNQRQNGVRYVPDNVSLAWYSMYSWCRRTSASQILLSDKEPEFRCNTSPVPGGTRCANCNFAGRGSLPCTGRLCVPIKVVVSMLRHCLLANM